MPSRAEKHKKPKEEEEAEERQKLKVAGIDAALPGRRRGIREVGKKQRSEAIKGEVKEVKRKLSDWAREAEEESSSENVRWGP